jgi:hypothetical protein
MSLLSEVSLVILVETPYSLTLKADQSQFFRQFLDKKRSCVLINGFSQDHEISRQHLPYWSDLPSNITFRGANPASTSMQECAATATRINDLLFKYADFGRELDKRHREMILRLNDLYLRGEVNPSSHGIIVSRDEMTKIATLGSEIQALHKPLPLFPPRPTSYPSLPHLHNMLKKYEKVCVIWTVDQLRRSSLEQLKVPYLVLLSEEEKPLYESGLSDLSYPSFKLVVLAEESAIKRGTETTTTYDTLTVIVSKRLEQLFHPAIRGVLKT